MTNQPQTEIGLFMYSSSHYVYFPCFRSEIIQNLMRGGAIKKPFYKKKHYLIFGKFNEGDELKKIGPISRKVNEGNKIKKNF